MRLVALREGDREALPATSGRGVVLGQESGNLEALKAARNAAALQYQSLYSRHQELLITMSLKRGEAELIAEAAVPTSPSSPQPLRDLALGAVVGLMLGLGFAFLREQLDDRLHSREEVEEVTNLPVLCELPFEAEAARDQANVSAHARPSGRLAESVRGLRTSLTFVGVDTPLRRILVTSPGQGDGKSFVAVNLATVYAQAGLRTVLVSGDLRRPGLDAHFPEVTPGPGLTEVIAGLTDEAPSPNSQGEASPNGQGEAAAGNRALTTVLRPTRIEGLLFLPTGKLPPNPAELLGSQRAAALLESLSGLADVVVIDTPPVLAVTDAAVLARNADGVVLVAAPGHTHRMALARTATILPAGGVRLLGVVLNKVKSKGSSSYYYGAYYGARTVEQAKPRRLPWRRRSEADAEQHAESSVESSVS